MKRFGIAFISAVIGYFVAACASYALIGALSSNVHDRSVEAAMTSAFIFGPCGALLAFVFGFVLAGRAARRARAEG